MSVLGVSVDRVGVYILYIYGTYDDLKILKMTITSLSSNCVEGLSRGLKRESEDFRTDSYARS